MNLRDKLRKEIIELAECAQAFDEESRQLLINDVRHQGDLHESRAVKRTFLNIAEFLEKKLEQKQEPNSLADEKGH
jgi:hypothetical protein